MSRTNPSHGQKVTDSNAPEIQEGAGPIASDSLGADSTRTGGGFSSNRKSEPQSVSGSNSTSANTNTSGAEQLDPAADAEARMLQEDWAEERMLGGAAATSYSGPVNEQGSKAGTAPSYVNSQYLDGGGPKGKNLTEGGFDSDDAKNASFNNEIGTKMDPGRLAEQKMIRENADAAGDVAMRRQKGVSGDNTFDALEGDTSA